ncbi:MAG: ferrochelatase [Candidatus Omnitrophica bacterium]|nr:ferrochelatase [Candidatus Omnitrophota bacterium]
MDSDNAVWLMGFGGPGRLEEVPPFLQSVLGGAPISEERRREVLKHYEAVGGVSPYCAQVERFRRLLEEELRRRQVFVPVLAGFRHSRPSFEDVFLTLRQKGVKRAVGIVLSPFRCEASFDRYLARVEEARRKTGAGDVEISYAPSFHRHPLFIEAHEAGANGHSPLRTYFLFSAHSVPLSMAGKSGYEEQFREAASLAARRLGLKHWGMAYQSRSGRPQDPWLGPLVQEVVRKLNKDEWDSVCVIPIGFLCDNVEIRYDLDIELKGLVEESGFNYVRTKTVVDHPRFVEMMGDDIFCNRLDQIPPTPF